ncbi:UDP-N-acetylmuramate dehydrogenase [Rhodococcus sp. PAMC28707]|uniref:UDP-N-acetylmuramate dehydrogenase n=1 Tax=unclassified Rhodococcus (in: high G+C Gram-positive bacteria) TaxID=192944 RepID=UPI00109E14DC|nr:MULTISPECIES: UDP-N-acetylmuramate dehydrogenase [unclassified Rhodococcus (in: high G+C Gram-positive bacteria)]QCB48927.1 UDP-N-acetylmuramate dehydrogenase [Rhodococcus sp. PAMC28705]QCB59386.1 UDP-N-acetylmuramate dehydrogenase [Rhodococcus sp. PAMC28707]
MPTAISELTTMRVGGPAREFAVAASSDELVALVQDADASGTPVLLVGGGSNLVVGDDGFDGLVVKVETSGMRIDGESLWVAAGTSWDSVVAASLDEGLAGLEALSGIPGLSGATPVQNVGAYGTVTSDVLASLTVYDRVTGERATWTPNRCGFGLHRQSVFKHSSRYVILDTTMKLRRSESSDPVRYAGLADRLGVSIGDTVAAKEVREAVLDLRGQKGMVLDAEDHDTWSVGSFFLNPVLTDVPVEAARAPQYPDPSGIKVHAAWLIQNAGFAHGYGREFGAGTVSLSTKHVLAVTNRGGARTADVMAFASHIRDGVEAEFGITLVPECDLVGCSLN